MTQVRILERNQGRSSALHCSGLSARLALGRRGPASEDSKSSRVLIVIDYVFTSCLLPKGKTALASDPSFSHHPSLPIHSCISSSGALERTHTHTSVRGVLSRIRAQLHFFLSTFSAKQTSRLLLCLSARMALLPSVCSPFPSHRLLHFPLLCHFLVVTPNPSLSCPGCHGHICINVREDDSRCFCSLTGSGRCSNIKAELTRGGNSR